MASLGIATAWPFFGFGRCIQPAFDALLGIVDDVLAVDVDTVERAKAIVLATGGIGKAFEITSNSWEYSGDGQALAYEAGAELIDMEFVQFHPTGMVWPPGVRGLLVTEAVRGEGGILRNALRLTRTRIGVGIVVLIVAMLLALVAVAIGKKPSAATTAAIRWPRRVSTRESAESTPTSIRTKRNSIITAPV